MLAVGDRLRFRGPAGAITPELRAALTEHKAAIVSTLGESCPTCRRPFHATRRGEADLLEVPLPAVLELWGRDRERVPGHVHSLRPDRFGSARRRFRWLSLPTLPATGPETPPITSLARTWVVWVHRGDRWGWTPKRLTWSRDRAVQAGRRLKGKPRWCVTTGLASPTKDTATGAVLGDEE